MKRALFAVGVLTGLAVIALLGSAFLIHRYMHMPVSLHDDVSFVIEPGVGLRQVSLRLHERGIISEPEFFQWYSRLQGKAGSIRAGEYRILAGVTPAQLLDQFVAGDVMLHSLTVVEGWTFAQMQALVANHPAVRATANGKTATSIMAAIGDQTLSPEGQFFPDTYHFPRGTADMEIYRRAHALMRERLADAWSARQPDLPLKSAYEALILASIVEKETALESERAAIAGVFIRRLRRGMRLQTDPTVIYGLGPDFDGNIRRRDLETDTPYNTYTRSGLPPTPIALPGGGALRAAVQPQAGEELYFVATGLGDGSHYFSSTLEQHNQAVQRYLKTLRERRQNQ